MLLSQKIKLVYDKMLNGQRVLMIEVAPLIEEAKLLERSKGIDIKKEKNNTEYLPYF